jgi:hypothetical protein
VSAYDPKLHEPSPKLEAIEARLTNQEQTVRLGLIWLCATGSVALALLGYIAALL